MSYLVLNPYTTVQTKISTPLSVDFPFQVERLLLVRNVSGCNDERQTKPEEQGIKTQESSVVQEDPGESHHGRQQAECTGTSRD